MRITGKKSRLRMLGEDYLNRVKAQVSLDEAKAKLRNITEPMKAEARANTENFAKWWEASYPEEYRIATVEVRENKRIPHNTALTLRRMNQWRQTLKYFVDEALNENGGGTNEERQ